MRKIFLWFAVASVLLGAAVWSQIDNDTLETTEYIVYSDKLPPCFSGFRIAQISDLHNASFGENNKTLLSELCEAQPDIIVITGDLVDSRHPNISIALDFCKAAGKIAPVYYVTGNHESRMAEYDVLKQGLVEIGVAVLEDQSTQIRRGEEWITLIGVLDPAFHENEPFADAVQDMQSTVQTLQGDCDGYTVLLSHRPELLDAYVNAEIDLAFTGHVHGGQIRLPVLGGLFGPDQGVFPQYDAGIFTQGQTQMIVSRGLGNSVFPYRVNNPPEIVIAELNAK